MAARDLKCAVRFLILLSYCTFRRGCAVSREVSMSRQGGGCGSLFSLALFCAAIWTLVETWPWCVLLFPLVSIIVLATNCVQNSSRQRGLLNRTTD